MAEIIFRAEKVVKQYKKKKNSPALNGIDMEIHKGIFMDLSVRMVPVRQP